MDKTAMSDFIAVEQCFAIESNKKMFDVVGHVNTRNDMEMDCFRLCFLSFLEKEISILDNL